MIHEKYYGSTAAHIWMASYQLVTRNNIVVQLLVFRKPRHMVLPAPYHISLYVTLLLKQSFLVHVAPGITLKCYCMGFASVRYLHIRNCAGCLQPNTYLPIHSLVRPGFFQMLCRVTSINGSQITRECMKIYLR